MMANSQFSSTWFEWATLRLWIPGLILGVVIYFAAEKIKKPYTIPLLMLAVTALFYGLARAMDISMLLEGN